MTKNIWQRFEIFSNGIEDNLKYTLKPSNKRLHEEIRKYSDRINYLIIQAGAYFQTADSADLSVRPNLLYYGVISLSYALFMYRLADKVDAEKLVNTRYQPHHGLKMVTYIKNFCHDESGINDMLHPFRAKIVSKNKDEFFGTFKKFYDSIEAEYIGLDNCEKKNLVFYKDVEFSLHDLFARIPETAGFISGESSGNSPILRPANWYISMFIMGMMARYYSDFWVRWIKNSDYRQLMEVFCGLVTKKFPETVFCQFKGEREAE